MLRILSRWQFFDPLNLSKVISRKSLNFLAASSCKLIELKFFHSSFVSNYCNFSVVSHFCDNQQFGTKSPSLLDVKLIIDIRTRKYASFFKDASLQSEKNVILWSYYKKGGNFQWQLYPCSFTSLDQCLWFSTLNSNYCSVKMRSKYHF